MARISGRTTVTTAGTRVVISPGISVDYIIVTAETDNTGLIVIGGGDVVAALATRKGNPLYPGDSITLTGDDPIYIDSEVSTDGVTWQADS
jgi:hypothetical protein